jgi:hypothetical protein
LVPAFVTLHNAEEAVAFRRVLPTIPTLLPPPFAAVAARLTYPTLLIALVVVSLLNVAVAIVVSRNPTARWGLWLLLVVEATMAVNAVSHALLATIIFRGYAPGVVTALVVNIPFAVYCFRRAARENWVSRGALGATIPAALVVHGPVLAGVLWLATRASG